MRIYVNGVLQGGSAGIPGTPAEVLLDASAPSTFVALNAQGVGTQLNSAASRTALGVLNVASVALRPSLASTQTSVGHDVLAWQKITPANYSREGMTTNFSFQASGRVSPGVTGTLVLYNVTTSSTVATLSWTETDLTPKSVSMAVPLVATQYELRFSMSGGTNASAAFASGVSIEVTWS